MWSTRQTNTVTVEKCGYGPGQVKRGGGVGVEGRGKHGTFHPSSITTRLLSIYVIIKDSLLIHVNILCPLLFFFVFFFFFGHTQIPPRGSGLLHI